MRIETKVFWLLAASFLVGLLFDLIPWAPAPEENRFPLVYNPITLEWYIYLCGEKLSRMFIFWALFLATRFKIVNVFLWLEVLDLVDFMLIMNKPWFQILLFGVEVPFEFNTAKLCTIIIFPVYLWIKRH